MNKSKSHIEKRLSHLYQEHGQFNIVLVNGLLISFERDVSGNIQLYVYSNSEYDCFDLQLDNTSEFPIVCEYIDKRISDKLLGCVTN